jgi:hypothetical protein
MLFQILFAFVTTLSGFQPTSFTVPEEILKIKYCLVEGNKKKRESYICM